MKEDTNIKTQYICPHTQGVLTHNLNLIINKLTVAGAIGHQPAAICNPDSGITRGEVLRPACPDPTPGSANHFLQATESVSFISSHPEFTDNSQSAPATKYSFIGYVFLEILVVYKYVLFILVNSTKVREITQKYSLKASIVNVKSSRLIINLFKNKDLSNKPIAKFRGILVAINT